MGKDNIEELLAKYLAGNLTPEEKQELEEWLAGSEKKRKLLKQAMSEGWIRKELAKLYQIDENAAWKRFNELYTLNEDPVAPVATRSISWWKYIAAASLILFALAWLYMYTSNHRNKGTDLANIPKTGESRFKNDVDPGGNKAVLVLADGSTISLDNSANGTLAQQGNARVQKTEAGKLVYDLTSAASSTAAVLYNTITTPRGGQYQVTLPDGTKVWLNAASSLRFPTSFNGDERRVTVTGEAYFEVAKAISPKTNTRKPFIVSIQSPAGKSGEVEVLGTHFNISAYSDEPTIRTTLLEGSVLVHNESSEKKLVPGQQAQFATASQPGKSGSIKIQPVDVEQEVAWKNGYFTFKDATITDVMKQIGRWYDVEIQYDKEIPDVHFQATKISRNLPVSTLLRLFELTKEVSFQIEGKKIIVTR